MSSQDPGILQLIGYGTPKAASLPTQMCAIDELTSQDSEEILAPSMAPQGFLKFQASLTQEEKQEQIMGLAEI